MIIPNVWKIKNVPNHQPRKSSFLVRKLSSHWKKQTVWGPAEPPSELQRPLRVASFLWPLGVLVIVTYWVPEVVGKSNTETPGFW